MALAPPTRFSLSDSGTTYGNDWKKPNAPGGEPNVTYPDQPAPAVPGAAPNVTYPGAQPGQFIGGTWHQAPDIRENRPPAYGDLYRDYQMYPELGRSQEILNSWSPDPNDVLAKTLSEGMLGMLPAYDALRASTYAHQRDRLMEAMGLAGKSNELDKAYWNARGGPAQYAAQLKHELLGGEKGLLANQLADLQRRIDMGRFGVRSNATATGGWGSRGMGIRLNDLDRQLMLGTSNNQIQLGQLGIQGRQIDADLAEQLANYAYRAQKAGLEGESATAGYQSQLGTLEDQYAMNNLESWWKWFQENERNKFLTGKTTPPAQPNQHEAERGNRV